ncbi:MAG: hypothetical protein U1E15_05890 [Hyphomicrobiales bacterium]
MGEGYTSLFFLDEVTALAAGHRPCFECRRAEARAMLGPLKADAFDRLLHAERLSPARMALPEDLPDGAMLQQDERFWARRRGHFLRWSFAGYDAQVKIGADKPVRVLTPPTILSILQKGYQPRWHASALTWDD